MSASCKTQRDLASYYPQKKSDVLAKLSLGNNEGRNNASERPARAFGQSSWLAQAA